jgi:hypothetical protein
MKQLSFIFIITFLSIFLFSINAVNSQKLSKYIRVSDNEFYFHVKQFRDRFLQQNGNLQQAQINQLFNADHY